VADYTGSRRVGDPHSGMPDPETARSMFAEDDAAATCPKCSAAIRPGQEWCTLCLHVLRAPEPPPAPVSLPPVVPAALASPAAVSTALTETGEAVETDAATGSRNDVEAAAEALHGQLAIDTRRDSFKIPAFLDSKARIAVFVTVAMTFLSGACLATMGVLGRLLG
jgi:hypothetical protein